MRWRVHADRLVVLLAILGAWQVSSAYFGSYWLSTPWTTVSRFLKLLMSG